MPLFLIPLIILTSFLASCGVTPVKKTGITSRQTGIAVRPVRDVDIADVQRIPQQLDEIAAAAGAGLDIGDACRNQLLQQFERNFFRPWTFPVPLFDPAESKTFMKQEARSSWLGVNRRRVQRALLQSWLQNCDIDNFPSRNLPAIAVAPAHLRGLPTPLPLYKLSEGPPFDMLSYPQMKLNEPLRVLHVSRDGAWYFVESAYSNGWVETRDVAFVDQAFISGWMQGPRVVIVKDLAAVSDGKGIGNYQSKIGTVLPFAQSADGFIEARVASAGEGGKADVRLARLPIEAAAPFPLAFTKENIALIGNQMLGQPYGWGELYGLRDCSALVRDFFLPFGIWMPRTALDQIDSTRQRVDLKAMAPEEKESLIKSKGVPFLTLLFKPGHIMIYVGIDQEGRPLVFQDEWSIRVKDKEGERTQIIGSAVITTLKPGEELGLVEGGSLLEKATEMGTVTGRCAEVAGRKQGGMKKGEIRSAPTRKGTAEAGAPSVVRP